MTNTREISFKDALALFSSDEHLLACLEEQKRKINSCTISELREMKRDILYGENEYSGPVDTSEELDLIETRLSELEKNMTDTDTVKLVKTITVDDFHKLLQNGGWTHDEDSTIDFSDVIEVEFEDVVEVVGTTTIESVYVPSMTDNDNDFGLDDYEVTITYSEGFVYHRGDEDSFSSVFDTNNPQIPYEIDGLIVLDESGKPITYGELDRIISRYDDFSYIENIRIDIGASE